MAFNANNATPIMMLVHKFIKRTFGVTLTYLGHPLISQAVQLF